MGAWGDEPWDNDAAADWFAELFKTTKLATKVEQGLNADLESEPEIVRAAAHLVVTHGRPYVWPIERLDRDIRLAIERLKALLDGDEAPKAAIRRDIRTLQGRLKKEPPKKPAEPKPPETASSLSANALPMKLLWSADICTPGHRDDPKKRRYTVEQFVRSLLPLDHRRLLAYTNNYAAILDATTGAVVRDLSLSTPLPWSSKILLVGADLFVHADMDTLLIRSLRDGEIVQKQKLDCRFDGDSLAASASSGRLLILEHSGAVRVLDGRSGRQLLKMEHPRPKSAHDGSCAITSDGEYGTTSWPGSTCLWNLETGELVKKVRAKRWFTAFTPDDRQVLIGTSPQLSLWEVKSGVKVRDVLGQSQFEGKGLITPDSQFFVEISDEIFDKREGLVRSVRKCDQNDAPYFSRRGGTAWHFVGDDKVATWRDGYVKAKEAVTSEVRLWRLAPLEIIAACRIEVPRVFDAGGSYMNRGQGQFCRIASSPDGRLIFASDGDARVYAIEAPK